MAIGILVILACLMAALQIFLRRSIRHNATHFVRGGSNESSLTPLERWTLAVIARYLMPLELPIDVFRPPESRRVPMLTSMLAKDWGVKDRTSLLSVIEHLRTDGYRKLCAQSTGQPAEEFLAWDLMRAVLIAWAGVNLDWITYAEFVTIVSATGSQLQTMFVDWPHAVQSYEAGCVIWASAVKARKMAERTHLTFQTLLHDPESPWKWIPWKTLLVGTIAE